MSKGLSRRQFLVGAGIASVGAMGAAGMSGCAPKGNNNNQSLANTGSYTYADTIAWNAEYDVVVVGFGGSGAHAAIYAADAGASVLLCDKAPEGHEGGNTRYCDQLMITTDKPDEFYEYCIKMQGDIDHDPDAFKVYSEGIAQIGDYLRYLGVESPYKWSEHSEFDDVRVAMRPQWPEYTTERVVDVYTINAGEGDQAVWQTLRQNVMDRSDKISVWLESPAKHLIQDPLSKAIVGVEIEKQGETVLVHAKNGVVMACGGFEANAEMLQNYIGAVWLQPEGSFYNTGDGIRMATEVGADLWHMWNYESAGRPYASVTMYLEGEERVDYTLVMPNHGSLFVAGDDGSRFVREDIKARHGRMNHNGRYWVPRPQQHPHLIFDQTELDEMAADGLDMSKIEPRLIKADTVAELAEKIEADPDVLQTQIDHFNFFATSGTDYQLGREGSTMRAFDGGALYAIRYMSYFSNTQGGPRRNADAQIVDIEGNPIPHLYSCGELGSIWANLYQGAGNMAECLVYGKIAGENAAAEKDPLPVYSVTQKQPDILYAVGQGDLASEAGANVELGENQYLGTSEHGQGGKLQLKVTYANGTIEAIDVVLQNETPEVGGLALEPLTEAALAANSADIDAVSGATNTSKAFMEALNDAIAQAS